MSDKAEAESFLGSATEGSTARTESSASNLRAQANRIYRRAIWLSIREVLAEWFGRPHPEDFCQRCKRPNVHSWHAPSPLWNAVLRDPATGVDRYSIICPPCFAELAAVLIGDVTWCFKPHDVDVSALWTDSDGREWDAQSCLWRATIRERGSVVLAVNPSRSNPNRTGTFL